MMIQKTNIFLIVKPECSLYVNLLESAIVEHDLKISEIYSISNWLPIARKIYEHRIASEPPSFHTGFEGHLWLSSFFFGDEALAMTLTSKYDDNTDLLSIAKRANVVKANFRDKLPHTRDGRIIMFMNLKEI
ncbi:MAG TPA: hypothetical protein EYH05_11285, partial [Anaerolineae bacterium]|nr:hypothetical protein [Anaerolineae bacterium]